jgi:hypothetical protein
MSERGDHDFIGKLARLIGVADLPWPVRMFVGLLIGLVLLYVVTMFIPIFQPKVDATQLKHLQDWTMESMKVVIGAVVGIFAQAVNLALKA